MIYTMIMNIIIPTNRAGIPFLLLHSKVRSDTVQFEGPIWKNILVTIGSSGPNVGWKFKTL